MRTWSMLGGSFLCWLLPGYLGSGGPVKPRGTGRGLG
nr:MAG TPA: hypothetical protein [Caudoviricetes sp.]